MSKCVFNNEIIPFREVEEYPITYKLREAILKVIY